MKFSRHLYWLVPVLLAAIPGTFAVRSLFDGEFSPALNQSLAAVALFALGSFVAGLFTGGVARWFSFLGESFVGLFNFRVSEVPRYLLWFALVVAAPVGFYTAYKLHVSEATITHVYLFLSAIAVFALAAANYVLHTKWAKPAFVALGVVAVLGGLHLLNYKSSQIELYNQGMVMLDQGKVKEASELFDKSIAAYKTESSRTQLSKLIFPEPSKDLEARAYFHKSNCMIRMRKGKEAVEALKESLKSNPGNSMHGLTMEQAALRFNDALHAQANLEKLFNNGQGGGHAQGNQPGQGQPQPGNQPSRGRQPQPGSGKGSRNAL